MNITTRIIATLVFSMAVCAGMGACKDKGPVEQAGEEVDEAVDTLKHGGKESTANKLDDAADEVREGIKDGADAVHSK